jgi:PAS domain S-box-containing protein
MATIPDLFWLKDVNGVYLSCNKHFEKYLGATESEIIGKTDYDFLDKNVADYVSQKDRAAIAAGTICINEETVKYASDSFQRVLESRRTPVYDADGSLMGLFGIGRDITKKRQNQERLEMLGFALNNASDAIFIGEDKSINFSYLNDQACRSLGYNREEFLGMTIFDIDPDATINMLRQMDADLESGKPSVIESRHKKKDGTIFPVEVTNTRFQYFNKKYVMNIVKDISERKKAEEKLHSFEAELSALISAMTDVVFVGDYDGRYLKIPNTNPSILYKPSSELLGKTLHDVLPKAQADYVLKNVRQVLNTQKSINIEYSMVIENSEYWFDATISPMSGDKYLMVARDVSEQKKKHSALIEAEIKLKESEQRYREIFSNSHDSLYLLEVLEHSHFRVLAVNTQYEKVIGVTSEQCVGNTCEENVGIEVAALVNAKYQRCIDAGTITEEEIELDMPMGKRTYHSVLIPIRDNTGKIYRIMGVTRDITEEINKKQEIEIGRNLLSNAELVASVGLYYIDFPKNELHCSKGVYNLLGLPYNEDATENLDIFKYIHPEDFRRIKSRFSNAFKNKTKFDEMHRIIDHKGVEKMIHSTGHF